jgi:pentatricopeptide repeat protein
MERFVENLSWLPISFTIEDPIPTFDFFVAMFIPFRRVTTHVRLFRRLETTAIVTNGAGNSVPRPTSFKEPRWLVLERTKQNARDLLRHPPGTYDTDIFGRVKETLDAFQTIKPTDFQSIDLVLKLIERMVREIEVPRHGGIINWFCPPRYVNRLLNLWKQAARKGVRVIPPDALLRKLQQLSKKLPELGCDRVTYGIIMDGIMHTAPPESAPQRMEKILQYLISKANMHPHLQPNAISFNQVLEAWAQSGSSDAESKMRDLVTMMHTRNVEPSTATYNILLRFWSDQRNMDEIDKILENMKRQGITPSPRNYLQACYGYCAVPVLDKAETIALDLMWNCQDKALVGQCVQHLMMTYRDLFDSCGDQAEKDNVLARAEDLFERIGWRFITAQDPLAHKFIGTLLDIYAKASAIDKTEKILQRFQLNPVQTSILLKCYGKTDPGKATAMLEETLINPSSLISVENFHSVMNAWAESGLPDSYTNTTKLLNLMEHHPRCVDVGIRPNAQSFGILLKSLAASGIKERKTLAINLLDEMERRHRMGEKNIAPNVICYALAIKSCTEDFSACTGLLERMKQNHVPLHVRVYNEILLLWSKIGTEDAVEKSEMILKEMWDISKRQSQCRPDVYSYNLVLSAIRKVKTPTNYCKAWKLYEEMLNRGVEANMYIYTGLITHLSSFLHESAAEMADQILQTMETSRQPGIFPDYRHYSSVIRGWLDIDNPENATKALMRSVDTYSSARGSRWTAAPDAPTIDRVIQGWIHVGDLERATVLVHDLNELKGSGLIPTGPNDRTIRSLLDAWERSNNPGKMQFMTKLKTGDIEEVERVNF